MFNRNRHLRNHLGFSFRIVVIEPSESAHFFRALRYRLRHRSLLHENRPAGATRAHINRDRRAFVNQHVHAFGGENGLLKELLLPLLLSKSRAASSTATAAAEPTARSRRIRVRQCQQILFVSPCS